MADDRAVESDAGFTLVEMLIAISILALIASLSSAAIFFASDAAKRGGASSMERREMAVRDVVETSVRGARLVYTAREGGLELAFSGDAESLMFVSRSPSPTEIPGFYSIELSLAPNNSASSLMFQYWPYSVSGEVTANESLVREVVLLQNVSSFKLQYGTLDVAGNWEWTDEWNGEGGRLPLLMRIEAAGGQGAEAFDFDWVIQLEFASNDNLGVN